MTPNCYYTTAGSYIEIGDAPRFEICNSFIFNQTSLQYATASRLLKSEFQAALMAAIRERTPRTRQPAQPTAKPGRPARLAQRRVDEVARDGAAGSICLHRPHQ
jgi:hypothetical protein